MRNGRKAGKAKLKVQRLSKPTAVIYIELRDLIDQTIEVTRVNTGSLGKAEALYKKSEDKVVRPEDEDRHPDR